MKAIDNLEEAFSTTEVDQMVVDPNNEYGEEYAGYDGYGGNYLSCDAGTTAGSQDGNKGNDYIYILQA